jgi:hypothetical protein
MSGGRPANDNARLMRAPMQLTLYERSHFVRFEAWLADNPAVWVLFEKFAFEAVGTGRSHYSADAICHRIRWHCDIETRSNDGFKLNNNHVAFLARRFMRKHPEHADFFRLRERRSA